MSTGAGFAAAPAAQLRQARLRRALEHSLLGVVPAVTLVALFAFQFRLHTIALDFHVAYWPAASRLLHGASPYAVTHRQIVAGTAFVYPALSALLFAPLGALASGVAGVIYLLVGIACVPATLYALRVRDWRVYGVAILWLPVYNGWQSGNVTLPLTLLTALVWRHRDRPGLAGLLTAVAISIKPFVWPLGLWLLATRRWKAAAWALGSGIALNLLAWGIVGFNEISTYKHLASVDARALWREGYSLMAVAHHLGLGRSSAEMVLVLAAAIAVVTIVYLGVVRQREREAMVLAVALMLIASPLVWAHYFALLLVPLALCRPRLGLAWALPILMWPIPPRQPVRGWQEALAWVVAAGCLMLALRASARRSAGDDHGSRFIPARPA